MTKITLFKTNSGFANILPSWTLADVDPGEDHGGSTPHDFTMPAGYRTGLTTMDQPGIFDAHGNFCDIIHHTSGGPSLVTAENIIVLTAAQ